MNSTFVGFGSYVALITMVFFGINDAPAYIILTLGLATGMVSAFGLYVLTTVFEVTSLMCESMYKLKYGDPHTKAVELMNWYLYDQARMSNVSKRAG